MDNISTLFRNLNQRLSSPFFFSFLLSWCIFNWQIIIAFLFYKHNEVRLDGYYSYIDLVNQNTSNYNNLWYPLLVAFGYTFIYPLFKNGIDTFQAWSKNWGDKWVFSASKTSKIPITKYLELREIYKKRTEELELVVEQDSVFIKQIELQKEQITALVKEKNHLSISLDKWQKGHDYSLLNGNWEIKEVSNLNETSLVESIHISNGMIHYSDRHYLKEEIIFFYHAPNSDGLNMATTSSITNNNENIEVISVYNLQIRDEFRQLNGTVKKSGKTNKVILKRKLS